MPTGYGNNPWGSSNWGDFIATSWTKIYKSVSSWTEGAKASSSWVEIPKSSNIWTKI